MKFCFFPVASLLLTATLFGCAGPRAELRRSVDAGDFAGAAARAVLDPALAQVLAAIIVERQLLDCRAASCDASALVQALAASGRTGRPSLEALADERAEPVRSLSRIALARGGDRPRDAQALASHDSSVVRESFAAAFAHDLSEAQLLALAVDPSPAVRRSAIAALSSRPATAASTQVVRAALRGDPDAFVRGGAARATAHLGEDALLRLCAAAEDESEGVGLAAIEALSRMGSTDSLDIVERWSREPYSTRTLQAMAALCRSGRRDSCGELVSLSLDAVASKRSEALLALVSLSQVDAARAELSVSGSPAVQAAVLAAEQGDDPWLVDGLLLLNRQPRSQDAATKERPSELRVEEVKARLASLADSPGAFRFEALLLLGRFGVESAWDKASAELDPALEEQVLLGRLLLLRRMRALSPAAARLLGDARPQIRLASALALLRSSVR